MSAIVMGIGVFFEITSGLTAVTVKISFTSYSTGATMSLINCSVSIMWSRMTVVVLSDFFSQFGQCGLAQALRHLISLLRYRSKYRPLEIALGFRIRLCS
jgi:hypothetical protein